MKVPAPAYEAAVQKVLEGGTHHEVFETLRDHGTPVRGGGLGKYPASQAATALLARHAEGMIVPRPRVARAFDALRGYRLSKAEAEDLVYKILAPCVAGTGVKILLVDEDKHAANRSGTSSEVDGGMIEMLSADNRAMKAAGGKLAEAAAHVVHHYDGLHRLSAAAAAWLQVIANEGGRGDRHAPMDGTSERAPGA
ncbi:hypothetical protein [Sphingomonas sp. ACRSK]|uniref:hypothetical protein n=1 Tax=Sphingomonas sp. ACRSK TaxID=2918213 RepID=UPI001EF58536|nr:hypothetical protein [Sphingomonas sp. ACRSK]MCG7348821.1 hypothetical protein [Sphingomonas sp. ACRSK]